MVRRHCRGGQKAFGVLFALVFAACGGQSKGDRARSGSAGAAPSEDCTYNRVRYANGERFGDCQQCACQDGAIACDPIDCMPAMIGESGSGGSSGARPGNGGSATGGAGASAAGGAGAGGPGVAGAGNACELAAIGSLCVLGTPTSDGQDLSAGIPLVVSLQPAGCYSSSCTQLVSSSCNYLGTGGSYWISGFVCLGSEGDACTDDCAGAHAVSCTPGVTLEAGEYTIGLGGTSKSVSFKVPSHVAEGALCVSASDQK